MKKFSHPTSLMSGYVAKSHKIKRRLREFRALRNAKDEDIFSELARNFVKKGAHFLVNITNDAWFKDTSSPYQHMQQAVLRAVENRRSLVRSANTGISCFIDSYGKIYSYVHDKDDKLNFISGYKTSNLYYDSKRDITLYTKFGDVFILLSLIFSLGTVLPNITAWHIIR